MQAIARQLASVPENGPEHIDFTSGDAVASLNKNTPSKPKKLCQIPKADSPFIGWVI